ncbi:DNA alkylation repair protein [Dactylosporangium sp. NPDC049742]|uniref:DNA alkylation repair protein n=1 Tax=Dactylosporangium sp. NPDC049742 TaxID=3154737 RepID=UPI00341C4243
MSTSDQATAQLEELLSAAASDGTRQHWDRYLKGTAQFRGTPMGAVRAAVNQVWHGHGLRDEPLSRSLTLAQRWFTHAMTEDKLAAVLLIAEHLTSRLELRHADALAWPLEHGHISDWNVCDWYATKALHAFLTADKQSQRSRAEAVASWANAPGLWQRRAAVVAFVKLAATSPAPFDGFTDLVIEACAANLVSSDRFAHTGPGWVLRELSRHEPDRVETFVREHPELSPEAVRMATARPAATVAPR